MKTTNEQIIKEEYENVWESIDDSELRQVGFPYYESGRLKSMEEIEKFKSLAKDISQQEQVRGYPTPQEWKSIVNIAKGLLK